MGKARAGLTSFRGVAGEVVRIFVAPSVFLTLIPVFLFWVVIGFLSGLVANFFSPLAALLIMVAGAAWLVGRFAMPAAQGSFQEGFLTTEVSGAELRSFVLRYLMFTLLWALPCAGVGYLVVQSADFGPSSFPPSFSLLGGGFAGLVFLLLGVVAMLMPSLCFLVTMATRSFEQVFSLDPWKWLWFQRRHDIIPFYAALFGGIFVFFAVYLIPLSVIAIVLLSVAPIAGGVAGVLIYIAPGAASPVLLGRLSGAFIYGYDIIEEDASLYTDSSRSTTMSTQPNQSFSPDNTQAEIQEEVVLEEGPEYRPLAEDPPDKILSWIRQVLPRVSAVRSALLLEKRLDTGEYSPCLAVDLEDDIPLGKLSQIMKSLKEAASNQLSDAGGLQVTAFNDAVRNEIEKAGLQIYRRK